jgi:hypothetical protein
MVEDSRRSGPVSTNRLPSALRMRLLLLVNTSASSVTARGRVVI